MDKNGLKEYLFLKREIDINKTRIGEIKRQLDKLDGNYTVVDTVAGGYGGTQHYMITGFPYPEYKRKKSQLLTRKLRLEGQQSELEEKTGEVELYIQNIPESKTRCIFTLRYLEGKTWEDIAETFGEGYEADAIRKSHDRYLEKHE